MYAMQVKQMLGGRPVRPLEIFLAWEGILKMKLVNSSANAVVILLLIINLSCQSTEIGNVSDGSKPPVTQKQDNLAKNDEREMQGDFISVEPHILDDLQRPLGFKLPPNMNYISRTAWEVIVETHDMWEIYVFSGKKIGNNLFESTVKKDQEYTLVHVLGVENKSLNNFIVKDSNMIWLSKDLSNLVNIQNELIAISRNILGDPTMQDGNKLTWETGLILYNLYLLQRGHNGIYYISFDAFKLN